MPMVSFGVTAFITIAAIELLLRLPLAHGVRQMLSYSRRAAAVMSSRRISEHWKEKALLKYSLLLAGATLRVLLILLLMTGLVVLLALLTDLVLGPAIPSLEFLASWGGLATATVISILYIALRSRFGAQ